MLNGKQQTAKPVARQRLEVVQLLEMAVADLHAGAMPFPDQAGIAGLGVARLVWTKGASQLQPSVPVTRTPRSSR